ncbi:hypothetical protein [Dysgonomonas reticulitermitis]
MYTFFNRYSGNKNVYFVLGCFISDILTSLLSLSTSSFQPPLVLYYPDLFPFAVTALDGMVVSVTLGYFRARLNGDLFEEPACAPLPAVDLEYDLIAKFMVFPYLWQDEMSYLSSCKIQQASALTTLLVRYLFLYKYCVSVS